MSDESNMPDSEVLVERDGNVARVTINRPAVMNALSVNTLDELEKAIDALAGDDEIRAVVITGAGEKAFVAGADITEIRELDRAGGEAFTRLLGYGKAAELLMTGVMINAEQAREMKLVERIVPEGSAVKEATDLARAIAGKAPLAIAAIKRAMDASQGDHSDGFLREAQEFGTIMESEDKAEGLDAFIEKRTADWKGR